VKKLMAANWKMYKTRAEAASTARELVAAAGASLPGDREVLVIPPFTALEATAGGLGGAPGFFLGAQDLYPAKEGAFTGEISPAMLLDAGCAFALAGHSERRHVLGESDELVGRKMAFGLENGLKMILCVGEKIEERRAGQVEQVCARQLAAGLAGVPRDVDPELVVVAYEPVWAIGTGEVASLADIVEAHGYVRKKLVELLAVGAKVRIQYGGSVKPDNAADIIPLDNVSGVLVGGASLRADSFSRIVLA
jgi:triosephosphate isomerase (TIM)